MRPVSCSRSPRSDRHFARKARAAAPSATVGASPASSVSALRYIASASLVFPVDPSKLAMAVRLRPTSALISEPACDSPAKASRAARTCRCAPARPRLCRPCPSARPLRRIRLPERPPRSHVGFLAEQGAQLAIKVAGRLQEPVADLLELLLFEQEVFANACVERFDRLDRKVIPGLDRGLRAREGKIGGGSRVGETPPGRPWPASARPIRPIGRPLRPTGLRPRM